MTDQPQTPPVAPPAISAPPPAAKQAPPAAPPAPDPRDAEIARLRLELEAAGKPQGVLPFGGVPTVRFRVLEPHQSMTHGGVTVNTDWTDVPQWFVPALQQAAADAGVTIEQES